MAQKIKTDHSPFADLLKTLPPPPFELSETAARIYADEGGKLIALEMLKASDLHTLAQYAVEAATYIRCTQETEKEPLVVELHNKVTAPNHYRKLAETAFKNVLTLSDRLGLSPAARYKLRAYTAFRDRQNW